MKTKFKIYTPYGDTYFINENGLISKDGTNFSGNWIFKGLQSVNSNYLIPFADINKNLLDSLVLTYKNGNPKYTVKDIDHGSTRVWGNTKVHGVKSISFL